MAPAHGLAKAGQRQHRDQAVNSYRKQDQSNTFRWRKYLRRAVMIALLLPPLIFLRDVYRIPDYRGGTAYISTSPDGVFQGMNLYVPNDAPRESLRNLTLLFSGFHSRTVMAIADTQTGRMLAYVPIKRNDLSTGEGGIWRCVNETLGPCIHYRSSFWYSAIDLPPNRWHRLVAWGAEKLRGLGKPDFGEVEYRNSSVFTPDE